MTDYALPYNKDTHLYYGKSSIRQLHLPAPLSQRTETVRSLSELSFVHVNNRGHHSRTDGEEGNRYL